MTGDLMHFSERARLLELLRPTRLPVGAALGEYAAGGALLSYGADSAQTLRHLASFVDKILKGARPADLPMEQPTKFELVLNLVTAKSLGIPFPTAPQVRADQVIQ
jgi:putative ABC transport system substrate-binding protein